MQATKESSDAGSAVDAARREAMAVCAEARTLELRAGLQAIGEHDCSDVREPEIGLVMLRGRIGGDGAPFNLGEATVTRAVVRIASGDMGYSYILGRDQEKARLAALCDALWQNADRRVSVEKYVLAPIRQRLAAERTEAAAKTAATRVDFFTLVRGEDAS